MRNVLKITNRCKITSFNSIHTEEQDLFIISRVFNLYTFARIKNNKNNPMPTDFTSINIGFIYWYPSDNYFTIQQPNNTAAITLSEGIIFN